MRETELHRIVPPGKALTTSLGFLELPRLAEWGLALLASLMLAAGLWRLRG
jgi:hypothetical protein